ncbi:MAG: hypothetical protein R6V01_02000 [Thermoplasmatota archaeon]
MERGIMWFTDLLPHLFTITLGSLVMFSCSVWLGIGYLVMSLLGVVWFWATICTRCRAYGSRACPSGYGRISALLFPMRKGDFKRAFKRNIFSVALQWFVPLIVGIVCMFLHYSMVKVYLFTAFILVAFIYLPLASKGRGCSRCTQKGHCPWKK